MAEPAGQGHRRLGRRPTLDPASGKIRNAVGESLAAAAETGSERGPGGPNRDSSVPRLILAVSGGADSMALLHACAFLHRRGQIVARAVTVDHGLQGSSAAVADRVVATSESWGVPAQAVQVTVEADVAGLEAAAREARYTALEAARQAADADWILTAHTRNDQAETVLLGLMRGSGTRSLAGMSSLTGRLLRPLLALDRAATEASCTAQGIEVWYDPMNRDVAYARVRTRRLLASLEAELGQPITANLARTAELCRADADFIDDRSAALAAEVRGRPTISLGRLRGLEEAILTRVVRAWLVSLGVPAQSFGAARITELSSLIRRGRRGRLSLPGDAEVIVSRGSLIFSR